MDRRIGKDIHMVSNKIGRKMDQIINQSTLTHAQFAVLMYLTKNSEREIFQRDIEEEFGTRRSSVSAILSHLESKDYIVRSSVSKDARLKKITLTEKSQKIVEDATKIIYDFEKKLMSEISENEIEIFYTVLKKLSDTVDKI